MRHIPLAASIAWAAAIFIVSSFPNPPGASGGEWRYDLAHIFEYALLGALVLLAARAYHPAPLPAAVLFAAWGCAALYGISDEIHQAFVPNRDANLLDAGFDAMGAAIGVWLVFEIITRRANSRRRPAPATNQTALD